MDTLKIATKLIKETPKFNARLNYKGIDELAADIKKNGLMSPILVRKAEKGEGYEIIAGHRRYRACKVAGEDPISCVLWDGKEEIDAIFANLGENLAREDLTPYEMAAKCFFIKKEFDLSAQSIAARISGKSRSYTANLIRIMETVHEKIIDAWKSEHYLATTDFLAKLSKYDKKEQWERWQKAGSASAGSQAVGDDDDKDDDDDEKSKTRTKKRASREDVLELIRVIKAWEEDGRMKKAGVTPGELAIACLRYASGDVKTVIAGDFRFVPGMSEEVE